jgi:hypothetical protein
MNGFCSFTAVRIVTDEERERMVCRNQIFLQAKSTGYHPQRCRPTKLTSEV